MMQAATVLGLIFLFIICNVGADKIFPKRMQVTLLQHQPSSAKGIQSIQAQHSISSNRWEQLLTTFGKENVGSFLCGDRICFGSGTCCNNDPIAKCCPDENGSCCNDGYCCKSDYPVCCSHGSNGYCCKSDYPVCCGHGSNGYCCKSDYPVCCGHNCYQSGSVCCPPPYQDKACYQDYPVCCPHGKFCCTNSHPTCCTDVCAPAGYSCCSGGGACPAGFLCCRSNCVQVPISTPCSSSQLAMSYPGVILQDLNSAVKWLIKVEGLATKGFCPKPTSGLTIGLDVDMGQQYSDQDLRNNFTPDCLIARLRTFYGAKCSDPCYNPNTGVVSLTLTTSEAMVLSTGFVVANVKEVAPYGYHMSQNGLDVLASLAHWAGHICGYTCPSTFSHDYRLCVPYSGKMQNLVCVSVEGGIANNIQLKLALVLTQNEYKSLGYDAGVDRLGKEIQHLNGSM